MHTVQTIPLQRLLLNDMMSIHNAGEARRVRIFHFREPITVNKAIHSVGWIHSLISAAQGASNPHQL